MKLLYIIALITAVGCAPSREAAAPPPDRAGISYVWSQSEWRIQGHTHADPVVHIDECPGCQGLFQFLMNRDEQVLREVHQHHPR